MKWGAEGSSSMNEQPIEQLDGEDGCRWRWWSGYRVYVSQEVIFLRDLTRSMTQTITT